MRNIISKRMRQIAVDVEPAVDMRFTWKEDENSFDYPKIDESKCTECGKCLKVCSFEKKEQSRKETYAARQRTLDLEENASGGIFTVLAQEVLKEELSMDVLCFMKTKT